MALRRFIAALQAGLSATSAGVLFLMMAITAVDVTGRYVFNKPLPGGFEMTELLLAQIGGQPVRDPVVLPTELVERDSA